MIDIFQLWKIIIMLSKEKGLIFGAFSVLFLGIWCVAMQKTYVQKQNGKAKEQLPDPNCWTNCRVRVLFFDVSVLSLN